MLTQNSRPAFIALIIAFVLSLPLIAMQFSTGVDWDATDFIIMGILLSGTGLLVELVLRNVKTTAGRLILCGAILCGLVLIWAELAVGIFGSPFAGS